MDLNGIFIRIYHPVHRGWQNPFFNGGFQPGKSSNGGYLASQFIPEVFFLIWSFHEFPVLPIFFGACYGLLLYSNFHRKHDQPWDCDWIFLEKCI